MTNEFCRILVVDDDKDNADSLAMVLRLTGHQATTANDGASALESIEVTRPQVVLLDLALPGMNGFEIARQMKAKQEHLYIIAVTGFGEAEMKARSAEAGIDLHLLKPLDFGTVLTVLNCLC
jgi:DNA-binding response OmpR family regulator